MRHVQEARQEASKRWKGGRAEVPPANEQGARACGGPGYFFNGKVENVTDIL